MNMRALLMVFGALVSSTAFANGREPCDRGAGGVSHCRGQNFVCNNGTISQSRRICSASSVRLYGGVMGSPSLSHEKHKTLSPTVPFYAPVRPSTSYPSHNSDTASYAARVIGVTDGDTLTVLTEAHEQVRIRLAEIDAPEKSQAFGQRSKQSLSALCFRKIATISPTTTDRHGRTVAQVECAGQNANAEQVRTGMAWVYDGYAPDDSPLYELEQSAHDARLGLWKDEKPTPPWRWRHP